MKEREGVEAECQHDGEESHKLIFYTDGDNFVVYPGDYVVRHDTGYMHAYKPDAFERRFKRLGREGGVMDQQQQQQMTKDLAEAIGLYDKAREQFYGEDEEGDEKNSQLVDGFQDSALVIGWKEYLSEGAYRFDPFHSIDDFQEVMMLVHGEGAWDCFIRELRKVSGLEYFGTPHLLRPAHVILSAAHRVLCKQREARK